MHRLFSIGFLVMGLTGAGKSTFISQLTHQEAEVGHSLNSCTADVIPYEYRLPNGKVIHLIDTPGFDDTSTDYAGVFKKIAAFLCIVCDGPRKAFTIGGLIYVHRITDVRMSGSSLKSLRIFEKICGEQCFQHVTIVTTMWDQLQSPESNEAATIREKTLRERPEFFGALVGAGAMMERHSNEQSARNIVEQLENKQRDISLQLQQEMKRSVTTKLEESTAGQYLEGELENVRKRYEMQKKELEESAEEFQDDEDLRSEFSEQVRECAAVVERLEAEKGSLSVTLEDIHNEQAAFYARKYDSMMRDSISDAPSARMLHELQQKVYTLEKENRERLKERRAQEEELEELEDRTKKLEAAKKALEDQRQRDKSKGWRVPQQEHYMKMLAYFGSAPKHVREAFRRTESMPLDTKTSKKSVTKLTRRRSQSRNRQSNRMHSKHVTFLEEQDIQPFDTYHHSESPSPYCEEYDQPYLPMYDAGGLENPRYATYPAQRPTPTYTPVTPGFPSGQVHPLPGPVTVDPSGLKRNPVQCVSSLSRKYDDPARASSWQPSLQSGSYHDSQYDVVISRSRNYTR
ncbi:MMR-HSR1 multi-domain protein [Pyrenophora tritici-repentis]|nr:MMR-HSR1 multi-domain protein [Pyrenophora tritici-repentis]KAI0609117.1 MMR-HSR1 multi-domain protein [Pyrenophora tritici-repentis]KAI0623007.1 MMR-HSR1 multi-domain protein [Pyrenophora tritici-repentis]KAI1528725.1 MMR-HSR1 multi-domain protein [Pyrenophora tritici-repentis]KAI1530070.1 MMR-HSR1 multi-domain protein [Pyrenophora tritici-repentis]